MVPIIFILVVWLGIWLYFAWRRHEMLEVIAAILISIAEDCEDEDCEDEDDFD